MPQERLSDAEWEFAKVVCTRRQLVALDWWRRGAGYNRTATLLGISRDSARDRIRRGLGTLRRELERLVGEATSRR